MNIQNITILCAIIGLFLAAINYLTVNTAKRSEMLIAITHLKQKMAEIYKVIRDSRPPLDECKISNGKLLPDVIDVIQRYDKMYWKIRYFGWLLPTPALHMLTPTLEELKRSTEELLAQFCAVRSNCQNCPVLQDCNDKK